MAISRTRLKCKGGVSIGALVNNKKRKEKDKNPAGRNEEEEKEKEHKSRSTEALFQRSRARLKSQRGGGKSRLETGTRKKRVAAERRPACF